MAISKDEGATWSSVVVPGSVLPSFTSITSPLTTQNLLTSEPIAVDASGNLYAIWNERRASLRCWSPGPRGHESGGADGGVRGSRRLGAGVTKTVLSAIAVKSPGPSSSPISEYDNQFNRYLAESTNALAPAPTFSSATVNEPSEPLFSSGFDNNYAASLRAATSTSCSGQVRPSGDVWASFLKEMCGSSAPATAHGTTRPTPTPFSGRGRAPRPPEVDVEDSVKVRW